MIILKLISIVSLIICLSAVIGSMKHFVSKGKTFQTVMALIVITGVFISAIIVIQV